MGTEGTTRDFSGMTKNDQIISSVGDGVTVHDRDFRIIYQNKTMKSIFGECVGKLCYEAYQQLSDVCPDCPVVACFSSGEIHTVERSVSVAEKTYIFETCASPVHDKSGNIVASVEVVRNATKRKEEEERIVRLKNLYDALSRTNKAIMCCKDKDDLFREICRIAVDYGKLSLSVIGVLDPETGIVTPVASSGVATNYLNSLHLSALQDREDGCGPTGIAIREREPYVCNDFHQDPVTRPWRSGALESGIRSSAAFPLLHKGESFGALKVYSAQKDFFDQEIVDLLQEMAKSISFAIENFAHEEMRIRTEDALRDSEERLRLVLEGSNDGFWNWNINTRGVDLSPQFLAMLGYSPGKKVSTISAMVKLVHPADRTCILNVMYGQLSGNTSGFEIELRMAKRSQKYEWFLCRGKVVSRNEQGTPLEMSGVVSKISEKKRYEEELKYKSTHDQLTGLYNRAYFDAEMARVALSRKFPVSIVVADVDGLKYINDRFGHSEGDRIIKQAAQILQQAFRGDDVVARIGGDEFAAILQNTDAAIVTEAVGRIQRFQEIINEENSAYELSISLGSATAERSEQLDETLKLADSRMYDYKFSRKSAFVNMTDSGTVAEIQTLLTHQNHMQNCT